MGHWFSAFMVFLGSWLSGYRHRRHRRMDATSHSYTLGPRGEIQLSNFWGLLINKWALWQYAHTMLGAVQTGCFVMAGGRGFLLTHAPRRNLRPHFR